jgi:hypothetical protein
MLQHAVTNVLSQVVASLDKLHPAQYVQPCKALSGATIGKHVRHVIELFQSLEEGYAGALINYEKRKRNPVIENDKTYATDLLLAICTSINKPDKDLKLEFSYDEYSDNSISIRTSYKREILYNLEHTIHHMALIKIGISEISDIELNDDYGVASSTIRYRRSTA